MRIAAWLDCLRSDTPGELPGASPARRGARSRLEQACKAALGRIEARAVEADESGFHRELDAWLHDLWEAATRSSEKQRETPSEREAREFLAAFVYAQLRLEGYPPEHCDHHGLLFRAALGDRSLISAFREIAKRYRRYRVSFPALDRVLAKTMRHRLGGQPPSLANVARDAALFDAVQRHHADGKPIQGRAGDDAIGRAARDFGLSYPRARDRYYREARTRDVRFFALLQSVRLHLATATLAKAVAAQAVAADQARRPPGRTHDEPLSPAEAARLRRLALAHDQAAGEHLLPN